jgi:Zn-dependent protease with chaperone function
MGTENRWRRALCSGVIAFTVFAATPACLAHAGEDDEDAKPQPTASLRLRFESRGNADVHLMFDDVPDDWQPIQAALGQTLHCPPEAFAHPDFDDRGLGSLSRGKMKPEQTARYRKFAVEANQRQVTAKCSGVLAASGWTVGGTLPLQRLADSVKLAGVERLFVSVERPKSGFDEHSSEGLQTEFAQFAELGLNYDFVLTEQVPPLHLAYGYRNSDIWRQCAVSFGFLLLPFLLILWMRRAALRDAERDPTAAWFSYFKTLQWCVNGTMLLWMVARTSLRQGLQDMAAFRLPASGWQPAVAHTLIAMVPPWFVYLLCLFVSYEVFVRLRGQQSTRGKFLQERSLEVAAQFLPLMFFVLALEFVMQATKVFVLLMLAAYIARVLCNRARVKIGKAAPEALTTGELRDRVFELAKRAGVKIQQVFVVDAGRAKTANAAATSANTVMFTDYLLQRLSKREVDAVAGHELSHLRYRHPKKLGMTMMGVIFLPVIFHATWHLFSALVGALLTQVNVKVGMEWLRISPKILGWPQVDLVVLCAGFGAFYMLSRHFEFVADAGSVELVGDPEAKITALLKLSRLNLTPIQWGKMTGSILTHPTTLKRIQNIARVGNVSPGRVLELLQHHAQEEQIRRAWSSATQADAEEHYAVPPSAKNVLSTAVVLNRLTGSLWILLSANVVPAALVAWVVSRLHLSGMAAFAAYLGGMVCILAGYSAVGLWLHLRGRNELRQKFIAKFDEEGIRIRGRNAMLAGFAPGDSLRGYFSGYDWDKGFLWLLQGRLVYLGDKIRFALQPEQVVNIRIGQAAPGWWNSERIYIDWRDEQARQGTFSFYPGEPSTARRLRSESKTLCETLRRWKGKAPEYPVAPVAVQSLESPVLGEVTSDDMRTRIRRNTRWNTVLLLLILSWGASVLLTVTVWYGFCVVLMLSIYERMPYWRYKRALEPPLPQAEVARAQATGAQ